MSFPSLLRLISKLSGDRGKSQQVKTESMRYRTHSFGFERRLDLFALQLFPVYVAEEGVLLDVSLPLRTAAQTLTWMLGHQLKSHTHTRS